MAAPAIGVRRLWLPHPGTFDVDWSHPMASRLRTFITGRQIFGDGVAESAFPVLVDTPHGRAMDCSGNALKVSVGGLSQSTPPGVTLGTIARRDTGQIHPLTWDVSAGINGGYISGTTRAWQFRFESGSSMTGITFAANGSTVVNNVTSSGTAGAGATCVVAMAIGADKTFNLKGMTMAGARITASGASTGTTGWLSVPAQLAIGRAGSATGWVLASWLWERTFTTDEMMAWAADPFAMLRR